MDFYLDPGAVMGAALVLAAGAAVALLMLLPQLAADLWRRCCNAWGAYRTRVEARREIRAAAREVESLSRAALEACANQQPNRAAAYRAKARALSHDAFALAYYRAGVRTPRDRARIRKQRDVAAIAVTCLLVLIALVVAPTLLAAVRDNPMLGLAGVWMGFGWMADYLPENRGLPR